METGKWKKETVMLVMEYWINMKKAVDTKNCTPPTSYTNGIIFHHLLSLFIYNIFYFFFPLGH